MPPSRSPRVAQMALSVRCARVARIHEVGSFCVSIGGSDSPWIFASNPRNR